MRRWRPVVLAALGAVILVGGLVASYRLGQEHGEATYANIVPPILPMAGAPYAASEPEFRVPEGFLEGEADRLAIPLTQPGVRWIRSDGPNMPPLLSPCGGFLPSDAARVGGHQLALAAPWGWKLGRIVVYRDADAARRAMSERRAALRDCARHDDDGGTDTIWVWTSQPLDVGEEAMFMGGQHYRGASPIPGHYRGIAMRQGRTVMMYVDFGQLARDPTPAEVEPYKSGDSRVMAAKLAAASWN